MKLFKKVREAGPRLFLREYAPLLGWLVSWALITASVGLSGAIILLAASQLTSAVRSLLMVDVRAPLAAAFRRGGRVDRGGWAMVWSIEIGAMLLSLLAVGALAAALAHTAYRELADPLRMMALGLPALYAGPLLALLVVRQANIGVAHVTKAVVGVILVLLAVLFDLGLPGLAAALAARWWVGLLAVLALLFLPKRGEAGETEATELYRPRWQDIAAETKERGQRRMAYRLSKIVFSGLFGPFGAFAARTLRGTRQLRRVQLTGWSMVAALSGIALLSSSLTAWLLLIEAHPVKLVLIGALVRLTCIALGTLLWTAIARGHAPEQIELDDDDFD